MDDEVIVLQFKTPLIFIDTSIMIKNLVNPLTFHDDTQVIGCVNCVTSTQVDALDKIFDGIDANGKSPCQGVKNPTVFIDYFQLQYLLIKSYYILIQVEQSIGYLN